MTSTVTARLLATIDGKRRYYLRPGCNGPENVKENSLPEGAAAVAPAIRHGAIDFV